MTLSARMPLLPPLAGVGLGLFLLGTLVGGARAQATADLAGPTYAEVPEDIQIRFMLKSTGNYNMVGTSDMPVIVAVVLTNKTGEALPVFVTRYLSQEDDRPLDYPLGCAARLTDGKGTVLLQQKDHPDGYWSALKSDARDDKVFRKDSRNHFEVPSMERRAFSIPLAALLEGGGAGANWPLAEGKFAPGVYRFKIRWAGKESPEFSLTVTPK
jgi:hypothetical protein